jgi:hypothetical protein
MSFFCRSWCALRLTAQHTSTSKAHQKTHSSEPVSMWSSCVMRAPALCSSLQAAAYSRLPPQFVHQRMSGQPGPSTSTDGLCALVTTAQRAFSTASPGAEVHSWRPLVVVQAQGENTLQRLVDHLFGICCHLYHVCVLSGTLELSNSRALPTSLRFSPFFRPVLPLSNSLELCVLSNSLSLFSVLSALCSLLSLSLTK